MITPFFSVIMPIFNRQSLVGIAIQSVLNQQFIDFELICIDDGSSDKTIEIVENFSKNDERIVLIKHFENKGRSAARNTGIRNAKGKWICFLDSDDIYYIDHLSTHFILIAKNKDYLCFATNQIVYSKPKKYPFSLNKTNKVITINNFIKHNFISLNQISICNNIVLDFSPEEISYSEDLLFVRRVVLYNKLLLTNVVTTEVPVSSSRSLLTEDIIIIAQDNWKGAQEFCKILTSNKLVNKILSHTSLFCASILISEGKKEVSLNYFKNSIKYKDSYFNVLFYKYLIKWIKPLLK